MIDSDKTNCVLYRTKDDKIRLTIGVFVDETEGFVELLDLLIGESIGHLRRSQRKVKDFLDD